MGKLVRVCGGNVTFNFRSLPHIEDNCASYFHHDTYK